MIAKKVGTTEYIDPTGGLTNRELEIGGWYVRHIDQFKKVGIFLLLFWSVTSIGYGLWFWGQYAFFGYRQDQQLLSDSINQITDYTKLKSETAARDLLVSDVQVFRSGKSKYDFVSTVTNPNPRWLIKVSYEYRFGDQSTPVREAIILPNSKRDFVYFGHQSEQFPTSAQFNIISLNWIRVSSHLLKDVDGFIAERLKFKTEDFVFHPAKSIPGVDVPSVSLTITNDSAYSYWQPVFYIDLFNGDSRVGVLSVTESQFRSGEKRTFDVRLFGDVSNITGIAVTPIINIFDSSVFMKPGV